MAIKATLSATRLGPAERQQLLRRSFIFKELAPDLLERLAQLTTVRHLDRGAVLFQQGDEGSALYAVVEGLVRISIADRAGKEYILGLMEAGDVFGEIALLDGLPRTASATATEATVLLVIDRAEFLTVVERQPRIARHLIELLCERLRSNTTRLGEFAFSDLRSRLARTIDSLAVAHGEHTGDGVRIALKLSQSELSHMLGVTREAINKQFKAWSTAGMVRLDGGRIVIIDQPRFTAEYRDADA